ncbi:hypothetical protein CANINC_002201 [Pichia inconspicua]|uniref:Uncharacterized protein n=1 Tax=Pichia inconspicua TaxID=52247 RepID=A0A4T0X1N6_9ASCO|nr:hypothetical protein CANINC_002201 [[Candida] inconspicua]
MTKRYEYLEYLTLLQLFCESLTSKLKQDWIYDLCFSNNTITKNVIASIPPSFRFRGKHYNVTELLHITEILIQHKPICFDSNLCEYLIKSFHNSIINSSNASKYQKVKVIKIFLKLDTICFEIQDDVLCSQLDRLFHISIKEDLLSISDYINALAGKSLAWMDNSLASLEIFLIPEFSIWEIPNNFTNDSWPSVVRFLEIVHSLRENNINFQRYNKAFLSILDRFLHFKNAPHLFQLEIKLMICKILSVTDWKILKKPKIRLYFMITNSFFLFSPYPELKDQAFKLMMKVVNDFPEDLCTAFIHVYEPKFPLDLKSCLQYHKSQPFSAQKYIEVSESMIKSFNFDELLNPLFLFDNLDRVFSSVAQIAGLPPLFKQLCAVSFSKYNKDGDDVVNHALHSLIFKNDKRMYKSSRDVLTPRYPAPSRKLVRLYLFLLLRNPSERILNETFDIGFVDSLRYNEPDIISAFKQVFDSYTLPDKFMIQIIDQLANRNLVILQIIERCSCLKSKIGLYEHRFKLLEACVTREMEISQRFIKLFWSIENNEIPYERTTEKASPYYLLFKSVEFLYILWESYERTLFWKYLTEYACRHSELTELLKQIDPFVKYLRGKRYVYIDRKLVLPINEKELCLSDKDFQNCIKTKVRQHNNRMMFKKLTEEGRLMKKSTKGLKKKSDELEILKIKELEIDTKETRKFIVTIYPNGKKVTDDHEQSVEKELKNLRKLTPSERKLLFKTESMSTQSKSNYKERTIDMSAFIRQRIAIDLFKSSILGYRHVGLFVGLLFKSKTNFATASNQEISSVISKFTITHNDLALRLFWWFAHYLRLRNCSNQTIETKLKTVEGLLNST